MIKYEAIGIVEAKHFTTALQILDAMCKASDVTFLSSEKTLGGRLVTTIVGGSISNVKAAIEAAKLACYGREELIKGALLISKPHAEIMKFIIRDNEDNTKEISEKETGLVEENEDINEDKSIEEKEIQITEEIIEENLEVVEIPKKKRARKSSTS
jgi:microcompartment protein CcmL/EutN